MKYLYQSKNNAKIVPKSSSKQKTILWSKANTLKQKKDTKCVHYDKLKQIWHFPINSQCIIMHVKQKPTVNLWKCTFL